jgi:PadR family transcriptional regulator, regulatory protein PadR
MTTSARRKNLVLGKKSFQQKENKETSVKPKKSQKSLDKYTMLYIVCVTHCMNNSTQIDGELFENLRMELRRGCLVVAVLAQLKVEHYGYTLRKALEDQGLAIDEGTLYPLLRRLESQGLLASEWREENKRNKRFYRLSQQGEQILKQLLDEWQTMNASLERILQEA